MCEDKKSIGRQTEPQSIAPADGNYAENPTALVGMPTEKICQLCTGNGFEAYRGRQISQWIYKKFVCDPQEMTNLPTSVRDWLCTKKIGCPQIIKRTQSADGTTKCLLELEDEERIECVLMPYSDRASLCVSTQVGCQMGCVFCATGMSGFSRNLTVGEIVGQYIIMAQIWSERISHIVLMGMGEPLMNVENVLGALNIFEREIGISARRITVSTVGIPKQIVGLAKQKMQCTLAVSLHSADQKIREQLMPVSRGYRLNELVEACDIYAKETGRRVSFEYILIDGINDSPKDARNLAKLIGGMLCHVNLIPYNSVPGCNFRRSPAKAVSAFKRVLESERIAVTERAEKGAAESSACGQLRRTDKAKTEE